MESDRRSADRRSADRSSSDRSSVVGLTGGIGSGKSTVAAMLADDGAWIVDADAIAREVVEPGSEGLAAVAAEFGAGVLGADGRLDRAALAAIAFSDPQQRAKLDAIMHPRIFARTAELFELAPPGALVVHDVALLTELGLADSYGFVIVVDCPDELRVQRLVGRGLDPDDARRRIAAQATREQRLAIADAVIDNSSTVDALRRQVDALVVRLKAELGT